MSDNTEAENAYKGEVMIHQTDVFNLIQIVLDELEHRQATHDQSKLSKEEFTKYAEIVPQLKGLEFGSEEYKAKARELGPALKHHLKNNRHHPEYFEKGVAGMHLLDVIEMVCDWSAVARAKGTDPRVGMKDYLFEKHGITEPLATILLNTVDFLEKGD